MRRSIGSVHPTKQMLVLVFVLCFVGGPIAYEFVAAPTAIAKSGHGKGVDKNGDDDGEKGKGKEKKDKDEKEHDNRGKGGDEPVVVEPVLRLAVVSTPIPDPTPAPTAVPEPAGILRVIASVCSVIPAADADWEAICSRPQDGARFEVEAVDGLLLGWSRSITADAKGVAMLEELPPASYQLDQIEADWCHAESDNVDASGNVIVKGGETTTVWIYGCPTPTESAA